MNRSWGLVVTFALHATAVGLPALLQQMSWADEPRTVRVFLVQGEAQVPTPSAAQRPASASTPRPKPQRTVERPSPRPVSTPPSVTDTLAPAPLPEPVAPSEPTQASAAASEAGAPPVVLPQVDPAYLHNQAPVYPPASRRLGEQGRVLLRVYVDHDGSAREVRVSQSSGSSRLDHAAREAVARWKFVPARQGSASVSAWVVVPVSFSLEG